MLLTAFITEDILLVLIGVWILLGGILHLHVLMSKDNPLKEHPFLATSFLVLLCLGIVIILDHGSGHVNSVWIIGVVGAIQGIVLLTLGFRFRLKRI